MDFQIVPHSSSAQQQSTALKEYAKALQEVEALKEEKAKIETQIATAEQVVTLAAVNNSTSFVATPQLVTSMVEEISRLKSELESIVSSILRENQSIISHIRYRLSP